MGPVAAHASTQLRVPYTDFPAQFACAKDEILEAITRVLERGDFILGESVERFERAFAALCSATHAIGVANGTDALILAMRALGIGPGDEVLTVPNSWISSASSIALIGARPLFVDVSDDFLMDPGRIESAITPRTKAIMPVHLTGRCADMQAILAIARRRGLAVIEDAAQAAGATRDGRAAGGMGTIGCFSLHPLKNLSGVGDGGMVTTSDDRLAKQLRLLRNHGLQTRDQVVQWGYNSRLDTLQAAVLEVRLRQLPEIIEARRRHAAQYRSLLGGTVVCPSETAQEQATYHLFMIQAERRDALQAFLAQHGIDSRIHYPTPIHLQSGAASLGYRSGSLPVAEAQARRILSLPVHQHLAPEHIAYTADRIQAFYRGAA